MIPLLVTVSQCHKRNRQSDRQNTTPKSTGDHSPATVIKFHVIFILIELFNCPHQSLFFLRVWNKNLYLVRVRVEWYYIWSGSRGVFSVIGPNTTILQNIWLSLGLPHSSDIKTIITWSLNLSKPRPTTSGQKWSKNIWKKLKMAHPSWISVCSDHFLFQQIWNFDWSLYEVMLLRYTGSRKLTSLWLHGIMWSSASSL